MKGKQGGGQASRGHLSCEGHDGGMNATTDRRTFYPEEVVEVDEKIVEVDEEVVEVE